MNDAVSAECPSRWFDFAALLSDTFVRSIDFRRECASTSDIALSVDATRVADRSPLLVIADAQTAGRGRGRNQWWSSEGALTCSLRLSPSDFGITTDRWPVVSLATAIATADALAEWIAPQRVGLKWPNDVQVDGRKVCGILVEPPPGQTRDLVIGIGLNVLNSLCDAPEEVSTRATSVVDATDQSISPGDALLVLLQNLEQRLLDLGTDRLNLTARWARQCVLSGQPVLLTTGDRETRGTCRGVSDTGALLLETPAGLTTHFAGTVRRAGGR